MAYWLFKSEPDSFSWEEQVPCGKKGEGWWGVRNAQARNFMREMKKGDLGFFYHSNKDREIVGVVKVTKEAYPDHTADDEKWIMVDLAAVGPMPKPVSLADVKAEKTLSEMVLVKNSRLSVQPVTAKEWKKVCAMGGYK